MEEGRGTFEILTRKPVGRPRGRCEDNVRANIKEIGINTRNWIDSTHDRDYWRALMNAATNLSFL